MLRTDRTPAQGTPLPAAAGSPGECRVVSSHELFRDSNQLRIAHAGQTYTLRITRENKLILTK